MLSKKINGKCLDELQRAYSKKKFNLSDKLFIGNKKYTFYEPDENMLFLNQRLQEIGKDRALYVGTIFEITKHQKWKVIPQNL